MRAIVIGAGIGGTTAAIALRRVGIDVVVFERTPEPREVGAGIALGANAMNCLRLLDAHERILEFADRITTTNLLDSRGRTLIHTPVGDIERDMPAHSVVIHRADLLDALLSHLPPAIVHFGRACTRITHDESSATAHFANGSAERADFLVGADGIRSVVRTAILGDEPPRYSGYTGWRGIAAPESSLVPNGLTCEYWGRGARFGFAPCGRNRVYWYATRNTPPNGADEPDARPALLSTFANWVSPIPDLIRLTPPAAILRNDIIDRPPSHTWGKGRVTLLGDAAHPTTPNLGQGACMAIEDTIALARHVNKAGQPRIVDALRAYESSRMERTTMVTNTSWTLGRIGQWSSPAACAIRNVLTKMTPQRVVRRNLQKIVGHFEPLEHHPT